MAKNEIQFFRKLCNFNYFIVGRSYLFKLKHFSTKSLHSLEID